MAPGIIDDSGTESLPFTLKKNLASSTATSTPSYPKPLKLAGLLEKFQYEDSTPVIGREFISVNIVDDLLHAENADALLRDLAITISQRGVVFFRAQHNLTDAQQKDLVQRLGLLSGKPRDSGLHVHPVLNNSSEFGVGDDQISTISSVQRRRHFAPGRREDRRRYDSVEWHSDIQFEPFPADYTSLRLTQLPRTGGDTLFASGYEIYDRFSRPYQKFFEGLTATYTGQGFIDAARRDPGRVKVYEGARGNPANRGRELRAVHPVVRTNPVTGWKSVFALGPFPRYINELSDAESDDLLQKFLSTLTGNHDLQVRFKWRNKNDIAIWDNRSSFHAATYDYDGQGERFGHRAVGIGEAPYLDPNSKSRSEDLYGSN